MTLISLVFVKTA